MITDLTRYMALINLEHLYPQKANVIERLFSKKMKI